MTSSRYAAAYPPQVIADELEDDAEQQFNDAATQRALDLYGRRRARRIRLLRTQVFVTHTICGLCSGGLR